MRLRRSSSRPLSCYAAAQRPRPVWAKALNARSRPGADDGEGRLSSWLVLHTSEDTPRQRGSRLSPRAARWQTDRRAGQRRVARKGGRQTRRHAARADGVESLTTQAAVRVLLGELGPDPVSPCAAAYPGSFVAEYRLTLTAKRQGEPMTSIKTVAAALAVIALAGCASPPMPPIATHTFVILTMADDSAGGDNAAQAALQAHQLWLPQYGDLRRTAVEAVAQRLTHDQRSWSMAPAVDVSLVALVATHHDEGTTFTDALGTPRPEFAELLKRLNVDAVFVVTERTLTKGPFPTPRKVERFDAIAMGGWERVTIAFFDRTRLPGKEADLVSLTDEILETTTPEARAVMLKEFDATRRELADLLSNQGY